MAQGFECPASGSSGIWSYAAGRGPLRNAINLASPVGGTGRAHRLGRRRSPPPHLPGPTGEPSLGTSPLAYRIEFVDEFPRTLTGKQDLDKLGSNRNQ